MADEPTPAEQGEALRDLWEWIDARAGVVAPDVLAGLTQAWLAGADRLARREG